MRVLYKLTFNAPTPDNLDDFSDVQKDILLNWKPEYNLFSVTQLAERNGKSRGHVQRQIRQMVKMGLVERHCPKILNGKWHSVTGDKMKIKYHAGNIHLEDFGGRNFVLPDQSEGEIVLETILMAFVHSQQTVNQAIDKINAAFQLAYLMKQNKK